MRKTTRRLLSLLLAVTMIMSLFSGVTFGSSISAQAAENPLPPEETILGERHEDSQLNYGAFVSGDYSYEILSGGTCKITGYSGTETNLTIPSAINGYSVTVIGNYAFIYCYGLTEITIPESVTSIGESAFNGCYDLTNITIPESVTSIGAYAFSSCYHLTEITIPESVTSIGDSAFSSCSGLTEITIPESVTSIGASVFSNCSGLTKITIPESVTSIGASAFSNCSGLTEITILDGVTSIGDYAFSNCSGLTEIAIPESVTSIGASAFNGCSGLTEIAISENVTSIGGGAFARCNNLKNIIIHPSNPVYIAEGTVLFSKDRKMLVAAPLVSGTYTVPEGITAIGDSAFKNCSNLTEITIPDGVTFIGDCAFYGCSNLTEITIPDGVTFIGDRAFYGCSNLTEITIPSSVTYIGKGAFEDCNNLEYNVYDNVKYLGDDANTYTHLIGVIDSSVESVTIHEQTKVIGISAFDGCANLSHIFIPKGVTSIGDWAFHNCSGLINITIPDSITSIGDYAFYGCSNLTEITIPDDVTFIGDYAFYGCSNLTEITVPDGVTSIGEYAFYCCESLKSIAIPQGVTGIGRATFAHCVNLTDVTIPNSVTSIGDHAFGDCSNLTEITLPDGVTSIGENAFGQCEKLETVHIPASVTTIGAGAFRMCNNLHSITIPEGVTTIEDSTFDSCESLTEITIPAGVTSIGYSAFCYCLGLTEITIPANVRSLGGFAFAMCRNLTSITFLGNAPEIGEDCFSDVTADAYIPCDNETWAGVQSIAYSVICKREHLFTDYQIVQDPTCTVEGIRNGVCSSCGETDTETVPALGHVYEDGACTRCGQTEMNDFSYECLSDGTCIITGYSGNDSVVTIPSKIDDCLVTSIGEYAFSSCDGLTEIAIPDSVTSIGDYAFIYCYDLTEVILPNSITSIGEYAFYCCGDLKSITFLGGAPKIGSNCFEEVTAEAYTPCGVDAWSADHTLDYGGDISWKVSHIVTDYHITQMPTCTEEGIQEGVCSACGETDTRSVPATGHIYEDGICTSCGGDSSWFYSYRLLSDGTCAITKYWGNEDRLSIPSVIDGYLVTAIGKCAFMDEYSLQEVILPDSITSIGDDAFYGCENLTEIILPDGLTSIGDDAFYWCENLTEIIIPDGVTYIGGSAFRCCDSLTQIILPDSITFIGDYAFCDCESLTEMMIPESVISIGVGPFAGCSKLVNLAVHPNNPAYTAVDSVLISKDAHVLMAAPSVSGAYTVPNGVTAIGAFAFSGCESLTEIILPNSVTSIGNHAFENCDSLTEIILPDGVTSIGEYAFDSCNSLTKIDIPNSVTFIGDGAFYWCENLTEIILPDSITFIGDVAFNYCESLTEIAIPNGVTSIGDYAFDGCYNLAKITVPDSVTSIGKGAFYNCYSLNEIILPNSVNSIGDSAFLACRSLTEIIIPEGVMSIGVCAFSHCDELVNLEVHPNNPVYTAVDSVLFSKDMQVLIAAPLVSGVYTVPEGVTAIGASAFESCYSLTEIILPNSVTAIGDRAFSWCFGLTEIILPENMISIGNGAFMGCSGLTKIILPDSITSVGSRVFEECDSLEYNVYANAQYLGNEVNPYVLLTGVIDSSVESVCIPEGVTVIGEEAFRWCENLTEIILPDSLTSIGNSAFYSCDSLTEIVLPDSLTSIGNEAFSWCENLTEIVLPDSLTSIGVWTFGNCESLTEIIIPAGVTSIGAGAFAQCDELIKLAVHPDNTAYTAVDNVLFSKDMQHLVVAPVVSGWYTVPDGVTTIADNAFYNCYMLEGVVVPASVISIGYHTFENCYMDAVTFMGDAPQFDDNSFQNTTTTAYYPAGNPTWTEDKLQNYGGEITWVPYTNSQVQVIFKDWDGTVLASQTVAYGQMPVAPAAPVRDSDSEQYYYYFTGWDKEVTGATEDVTYTAVYELITIPTLTLKAPTLEFKDMITVNAMFTAENIEDVSYMGMLTYDQPVDMVDIWTADHVTYGTEYDETTGRYIAHSQGINAKYLCDTVYLACYARLKDGTYIYSKLASYSPVQYATNQLKNSTDVKLKQLCAAMLNYGAEAQLFFGHNVDNLANASLTDEQKALPEAYRADMVATVPAVDTGKQGIFANNQGFSKRYPAISFEGAFCINYFFTPAYLPEDGITLYYWTEEDYNAADVLTAENASGAWISYRDGIEQYRFDIGGIAARKLADAVYVAAVYSDGTTTWTSGVLGYSIGAYCSSQAAKGGDIADLAMATAVYGYHAKQYFA